MIESENNNLIQSKAKIETERKRLVDREKDLLAKIERDETIFKVMATLKEEKELAEQDAKSVRLKPEEAKKKNQMIYSLPLRMPKMMQSKALPKFLMLQMIKWDFSIKILIFLVLGSIRWFKATKSSSIWQTLKKN